MPTYDQDVVNNTRRGALKFVGASLAATALAAGHAAAQVPEEVNSDAINIVRKGIDKKLNIFNIDLLEQQASEVYGHGTYVFVANGSGKQWTLAENQRAWGDYAFVPQRMQGVRREHVRQAAAPDSHGPLKVGAQRLG